MAIDLRGYTFLVEVVGTSGAVALGGFSEAAGLPDGATALTAGKLAALRRGLVNAQVLSMVRAAGSRPTLLVTVRDEQGSAVRRWRFTGVQVTKYTGPTLSAKATDVAIEELTITADSITTA